MRAAEPEESPLIFHWAPRREISLALPGFLILSVLLHAATFYFFQISYPQGVTLTPPTADVILLTPEEANADLQRWVDVEDPALVLQPSAVTPMVNLSVPYHPSFENSITDPRLANTADAPVAMPHGSDLDRAFTTVKLLAATPNLSSDVTHSTRMTFTGDIISLVPRTLPALRIARPSEENLGNSVFYVGILQNGSIGYLFLESSSGDPRIDRLAEEFLTTLSCRRGDSRVTWGFATIRWGVDAVRAERSSPP